MKYKNRELISPKDLQTNLEKELDYRLEDVFNRLVIVRGGKKEAVIIPISEYEYMKRTSDTLEMQEISKIVEVRIGSKKRISHEEMLKIIDNRLKRPTKIYSYLNSQ